MNIALLLLLFLGTAVIQFFIGGMRPIFAIPGYAVIGLGGLLSVWKFRRDRPLPSAVCLISTLIFGGYILGRSYFSPVEYLARPDRYLILGCLIVYLLIALYLTNPRDRVLLFAGFLLQACGHLVVGAIQFSKDTGFLPFDYQRADYGRRASGFYVCPNHFAGLLEMLLAVSISLLVWGRVGLKSRMLLLYFTGVALVGVGITGSRGGYLSLGCAMLVLLVLCLGIVKKVRPDRFLVVTCASLLLLLVVGGLGVAVMRRDLFLASRLNSIIDTHNMRLQLWHSALQQYQQQPLVGTGSGTFLYLGRFFRDQRLDYDPVWVHNDYLQLLAEYGLVGAAAFLFFLGAHLWRGLAAWQTLRERLWSANMIASNSLALNVAALTAVAALIAHSVVDFNLHIPGNALVLAMLFGILASPTMGKPEPVFTRKNSAGLLGRVLLPLLAAGLLLDALPHLPGEWFSEKARVALQNGKLLLASREAHSGLKFEKTNPDLYFYLGEARRLLGNAMPNAEARRQMNETAAADFSEALKLYPQDEKLWVKRSQALDLAGHHEKALQHLDRALQLDPRLPALNTYFAAHYQLLGDNNLALQYYNKARADKVAEAGKEKLLLEIKRAAEN